MNGRRLAPELEALAAAADGGLVLVRSPAVGFWRGGPAVGAVVQPGSPIGEIEILGVCHRLLAPGRGRGVVVKLGREPDLARQPVGWSDLLMVLDPAAAGIAVEAAAVEAKERSTGGLVFRSPSSGRFYSRPSPERPPFVQAGDEIDAGRTVALLEVMKTFNRVQYGGAGLPERARVLHVLPDNGSDLEAGDVILELEPI